MKRKPRKYCECGCGEIVNQGMRYLFGHNRIGKSNAGNKHPMWGKKHKPESKRQMSISRSGANNPNWKGGKTWETYCPIWFTPEFKEMVKERDGHKCMNPLCKGPSKRLAIHHIDYDKKNCSPLNLISICNSCNARANFNRSFWQEHYKNIIREVVMNE